jgi:mannose-6-phosphate isomerase-like protein (cupin superfamily)
LEYSVQAAPKVLDSAASSAGQTREVAQGDLVAVPAGTRHNFRNTGVNALVLYTVYGPPEHADGTVHATKEEADAAEASGEDQPPAG